VADEDGAAGVSIETVGVSKTPRLWVGAIVPVETLGVSVGALASVETLRVWVAEGAGVTGAAAHAPTKNMNAIALAPPKRWGQGRSHV
jgi:hypothetical protein